MAPNPKDPKEARRRLRMASQRPAEKPPKRSSGRQGKSKQSAAELQEAHSHLVETVVRVKASERAKAHNERRLVKQVQQLNEAFHGTHKSLGADIPEAGEKPKVSASTVIEKPASPETYGVFGGNTKDNPFGSYGNLNQYSAEGLRRIAAQRAHQIYQEEQSSQTPQPKREEASIKQAVLELKTAYSGQRKPGDGGIDVSKLTIGEVKRAAFSYKIETLSTKEQAERFPTKKKMHTNVGQKQRAKDLKGKAPAAPEQKEWDREKLQKALQSKRERSARLEPGDIVPKSKVSSAEFKRTLSPDEAKWIENETNNKNGLFFGMKNNQVPGAYRRWQQFVNARSTVDSSGKPKYQDLENIKQWISTDTRGRRSQKSSNPTLAKHQVNTKKIIQDRYTKGIVDTQGVKATDRFKPRIPSHEDFGVGIQVPGIPSDRELKEMFPDASDREIVEISQATRQDMQEDILKNQRAAHEERQELLLGRSPSDRGASNQDRVVFLTTSTGWPAVSVGANSLLGQYIIKKRKKMVVDNKQSTRAQVKGEFPTAVRDQHLIEVATGLSLGAQGRYGAFKHIGYRAGTKKSKGYGKVVPVGAQVLKDSTGQPLYDRNGNLRYTEGFTRPFDVRPSNELGLRVYLG